MDYPPEFDAALKIMLSLEGGFSNNPKDPGGATNLGISLRAVRLRDYDKDLKLDFDLDRDGDVDAQDIKMLDFPSNWEAVQAFYYQDYWVAANCQGILEEDLQVVHFDCAVNQGVRAAHEIMARQDKNQYDCGHSEAVPYLFARLSAYCGYKNAPDFIKGWRNRLLNLAKALKIEL